MISKLSKSIKLVFKKESSISDAALLVFIAYIVSAFVGILRNRVLAGVFGDSVELGVFYLSDKLPSLIYSVIVLSVITSSFIPLATKAKKRNEADQFTSSILNFFLLLYIVISIPIFVFPNFFANLVSWGSLSTSSNNLLILITEIILINQVLLLLSSFLSSYLHTYKRFLIPAVIPILYNLGIVVGTLLFYKNYGILAPVFGMFIGNVLSLIFQVPALYALNFKYTFAVNVFNKYIKETLILTLPKVISVSAQRVYILIINGLISYVYKSPSYVVIYEFANQLQTMPVTAFGSTLSQAMMPTLSEYAEENSKKSVSSVLKRYLFLMNYFLVPVVVLFFILKIPIVRVLFGGDSFSWLGTNLTAYTLAFFSLSIVFQSVNMVFYRVFYAYKNSKIPSIATSFSLVLALILSVVFAYILGLGVWSMALSYSIASVVQFFYMYKNIKKLIPKFSLGSKLDYTKVYYAAFISGTTVYLMIKSLEKYVFDTTRTLPLLILLSLMFLLGFLVYFGVLEIFGVSYLRKKLLAVTNKKRL